MRVRLLTPLLLVAALAAGCGEDQEQPQALPSVAVTTATTAPSPTSAPVPTEAQAETPQGAAAFARHWYDQIGVAFETRNPAVLKVLSAPDCMACETYIASVTSLRDENERVDFNIEIIAANAPARDGSGRTIVTVIYNSDGSIRYSSTGEIVAREPARLNAEQTLTLVRAGTTWQVQEVTVG